MSRNVRRFKCAPDAVFEVLSNGWLYPSWVVGASRMREVDNNWPRPGARLHHSVGTWPALINDSTTCVVWDPPHQVVLSARGWPLGEARVTIDVKPYSGGCVVRMQEEAVRGPAALIPRMFSDLVLHLRNAETLHRLAYLAEGMYPLDIDTTAHREDEETAQDAAGSSHDAKVPDESPEVDTK
ncbi:SRPBCC family protein [Leucobacter denitrificans]|uniref:SRPBCC family protein n=1 Tax=Leucobacter denitrificans TaxID=683042 RepID=UPI001FECCCDB|nr:SRPBCC family protein [Leucobacter denitrificans]